MMRYELALGRALAGGRRIARAGVGQRAVGAVRGTCVAGGPAEQNQSVAEIRPLFGRKTGGDFHLLFSFLIIMKINAYVYDDYVC